MGKGTPKCKILEFNVKIPIFHVKTITIHEPGSPWNAEYEPSRLGHVMLCYAMTLVKKKKISIHLHHLAQQQPALMRVIILLTINH